MIPSLRSTVGDIVATLPHGGQVLQVLGIDACCRQGSSLAEASASAGIDQEELLALLSGAELPAEPLPSAGADATLPELTRYVVRRFHRRARQQLVTLLPLAAQVCWAHGQRYPEFCTHSEVLQRVARKMVPHMQNEEQLLFPYIETMDSDRGRDTSIVVPLFGTVEYPLQLLRHDHDDHLTPLREFRSQTRGFTPPTDARESVRDLYQRLREFVSDLEEHTNFEDKVLFPRAIAREKAVQRRQS